MRRTSVYSASSYTSTTSRAHSGDGGAPVVSAAAYKIFQLTRDPTRGNISILYTAMTCGSTKLTDEKSSKTSKRSAADSNNDPHPTISMDLKSKRAKIEVTLAASEAGQMTQIESEFQILKSLIPNIANKQQINEVRICKFNTRNELTRALQKC